MQIKSMAFYAELVSIPQAVGTVATFFFILLGVNNHESFNTASGRYCCNDKVGDRPVYCDSAERFNTASGRYCCNLEVGHSMIFELF